MWLRGLEAALVSNNLEITFFPFSLLWRYKIHMESTSAQTLTVYRSVVSHAYYSGYYYIHQSVARTFPACSASSKSVIPLLPHLYSVFSPQPQFGYFELNINGVNIQYSQNIACGSHPSWFFFVSGMVSFISWCGCWQFFCGVILCAVAVLLIPTLCIRCFRY